MMEFSLSLTALFRCLLGSVLFLISVLLFPGGIVAAPGPVVWLPWRDTQFSEAESAGKLLLLNLEATWCHWCHVMEQQTYSDSRVQQLLASHYLAVKVDQDSRPDLAVRYGDWGWPATIIFDAQGRELAKRAGFVEPGELQSLLERLHKEPKPEKSETRVSLANAQSAALSAELETKLTEKHYASFDREKGGLKISQKFLDADSVELSLRNGRLADGERDREMARLTLSNNLRLFDSVWGGVYQYSTYGDWNNPHFEKIMSTQAKNMRIYAFAYSVLGDEAYRRAAFEVFRYVSGFLRDPSGAFYVSQDADVKPGEHSSDYFKQSDDERRRDGIPRVDTNRYSRENGWIIEALAAMYSVTGDRNVLDTSVIAARWVMSNRGSGDGGFRHGEHDIAGPFLGDSLAMGRACLSLYAITAERPWLSCADTAGMFIAKKFVISVDGASLPGVVTTVPAVQNPLVPVRDLDENLSAARFANLLYHYTGKIEHRELANNIMRYLVIPEVALEHVTDSGILLAAEEVGRDPLHLTVVSKKSDARGAELFKAALRYPDSYKRVEWFDRNEGSLPRSDVAYPELPKAAAFVCSNRRCSLPVFDVTGLEGVIKRFSR